MADVAEWAAPGADFPHDHKGRGAIAKTFVQVRAGGFFADGGHLVLAQNILDSLNFWRG